MSSDNRCKLRLVGITYNQIESGVFALILQEADGTRRLPIVIGSSEAQSIECKLQNITPPRPLTHDLFVNMMEVFGLKLIDVDIKRINGGIFAANLNISNGEYTIALDARSSDAIAIAIRMNAPIYTSNEVLNEVGEERRSAMREGIFRRSNSLSRLSTSALNNLLKDAVEKEKYEIASQIKEELDKRKNKDNRSDH